MIAHSVEYKYNRQKICKHEEVEIMDVRREREMNESMRVKQGRRREREWDKGCCLGFALDNSARQAVLTSSISKTTAHNGSRHQDGWWVERGEVVEV